MTDDNTRISEISSILDDAGYYSVLLTYHSLKSDAWIKCARALNIDHKIKYMIAIRTYAISPEYFSMMCNAFEEIAPDRLMFNIVSGDIHEEESSVYDVIYINDLIDTSQKRLDYTNEWIKKLKSINKIKKIPEIVMAGLSEKTLSLAREHSAYTLCMVDNYKDSVEKFYNNDKKIVAAQIVIRENNEDAKKFVELNVGEKHKQSWTIFGSELQITKEFDYLESIGVTDIMLRCNNSDTQQNLVHEFVKKYNIKRNGIIKHD
jgi:alkanesulfonate monooxygenase SsuD/methylene tetrahydromethanopterin reductase-like flavin-dependent oxidoreductase (luciferase family)